MLSLRISSLLARPLSRLPVLHHTRSLTLSTLPRPSLRPAALESSTSQTHAGPSPLGPLELVRGGKRDTYDPSHVVRKRRVGFLARLRSRTGRAILRRRKTKGRSVLSH